VERTVELVELYFLAVCERFAQNDVVRQHLAECPEPDVIDFLLNFLHLLVYLLVFSSRRTPS
jgi:hypothetical protein